MRLAHVVQRFGEGIDGGSEALCREVAQRLAARHDVTVLTTCASDYVTWRSGFPRGESDDGDVRVIRFPCQRRNAGRFWEISQVAFSGEARPDEEAQWFLENGPYAPELLDYLERHADDYDAFFLWTYRYHPSAAGLPHVADRAILVPTAEADPATRIRSLSALFRKPAGLLFLTEEEAQMVRQIADDPLPNSLVIGSGMEPAKVASPDADRLLRDAVGSDDFILYLGRVDANKGCQTMFDFYRRFVDDTGTEVPLVVAGRKAMPIPGHPGILPLGFVSEELRESLLARARFLLMPSAFESLSLVLLEAWNHSRPALVNGACSVLRGQVRRADGGLYYESYEQFREGARLLLERRDVADQLGSQGLSYIDEGFRWPQVMEKIELGLERWIANR